MATDSSLEFENTLKKLKTSNDLLIEKDSIIENLNKELRQIRHEFSQLKEENSEFVSISQKKIEGLEELINSYKNQKASIDVIKCLEKKILELENSLYSSEQNNNALKIKIHELEVETSQLNIKNEKLSLNMNNNNNNTADLVSNKNIGLDNLDEETNKIIMEIIAENDELKKEKNEFQEKALERLTEKELQIIELREELTLKNEEYRSELSDLMLKISELNNEKKISNKKLLFLDNNLCEHDEYIEDENNKSLDSEEQLNLKLTLKEQKDQLYELKCELELKEVEYNHEKTILIQEAQLSENELKKTITNLENSIISYKEEISKLDIEKMQIEHELSTGTERNHSYYKTLEEYQFKIKTLEEQKFQIEQNYRKKIADVNKEYDESFEKNKILMSDIEKLKTKNNEKINEIKLEYDKELKSIKTLIEEKNKDIESLMQNCNCLKKEVSTLKIDNSNLIKASENYKTTIKETQETLKSIKETYSKEVKKLESKLMEQETKFDNERNAILKKQYNSNLYSKYNSESNLNDIIEVEDNQCVGTLGDIEKDQSNTTSLENALNDKEEYIKLININEKTINELKAEVKNLKSEINKLKENKKLLNQSILTFETKNNDSINTITNLNKEIDILNREIKKCNEDYKSLKDVYNKQISDLMRVSNKSFSERNSIKKSINGEEINLSIKQLQAISELHSSLTTANLEIKFYKDKAELLNKEKAHLEKLRSNDIVHYKQEIKNAEKLAIDAKIRLASVVFDNEEEMIKIKNMNKKLMEKLGVVYKRK